MLKKLLPLLLICQVAHAAVTVKMYETAVKGTGNYLGTVTLTDTAYGLLLTPDLHGLSPGSHGFHIHQNALCSDMGTAAGGHLDPQSTNKHDGPFDKDGHLGDLPVLLVDKNGNASLPVLAPRLTVKTVTDHSLMIHAGSDNYADTPAPLGGGGARIACGVIP